MSLPRADKFFDYARARYQIHLDRERGLPEPWTKDKILGKYRFCNVFREDDRTTRWFRKFVRDVVDPSELLLATVVFRMFNRISTGEAIFCQKDLEGGTPWDLFAETGNTSHLRWAVLSNCGKGPYVTGAYIISTPPGYAKLDGVLWILRWFWLESREWKGLGAGILDTMNWAGEEGATQYMLANYGDVTLEATWDWLRQFKYLGVFHSYEIVTDLRHTPLLSNAPDIMTWANPGPGAHRGLRRVLGGLGQAKLPRQRQIELMRELLSLARVPAHWPPEWPVWEIRDVEHTLCEFDKYERVRTGRGRPRGVFR